MEENFARVIYQRNSTFCRPLFIDTHIGVDKYTALPCSVGRPVSITIRYINSSYHNKTIACRPDQGKLITTTVKIREMLTSPEIDPRGVSTIEDGAVFSFKCTAKSIPKSSIEWYIGGSKLNGTVTTVNATENTVVSTIMYLAKKEHNNKILFCSANDSFTAMNSSSATLNIEYVPTVHIDPGVNPYIVYAGQQNVTLACIVDGANPADSINFHWTNLVGISSDQTIILANISNIHSGEYRCKAENKVGNSSVTSKLLMVQYAAMIENISDVIILEGDNLQLHPTVDANPAPVSFWWSRHNDANFRVNGSNLTVNVIQREATANYTFHVMIILTPSGISAINRTSRKTIHIDVQYGPQLSNIVNQYVIMEEDDLIVSPLVDSNPVHGLIWWTRQNDTNFRHDSSELKINQINRTSVTTTPVTRYHTTSLEYVVCKRKTAIVMWKQISNGDGSLELYVQYGENGRNMKSEKLQQDYTNQLMAYTVNGLTPNRKYTFSILAVNLLTESNSRTVECLTDVGFKHSGSTKSDDNKEQTSNTILRSVENMPEFESRPPQEQRIDSENIAEANTYDEMPTLPKGWTQHTILQPNAYEDMGPKFKRKTTEENVKDSNINIYESMKEQACGNTPTEDPLRYKRNNRKQNCGYVYKFQKHKHKIKTVKPNAECDVSNIYHCHKSNEFVHDSVM
ncbi:unnamed protein product [Mytilus edulis]|uniref:Ig-like domain-containing protein n=1 Tax=Mytilus edulis TaxID=6550 RepID=A0A8S3TFZ7_MYTED|nr:unnamed protein product [Mytilus edulis]